MRNGSTITGRSQDRLLVGFWLAGQVWGQQRRVLNGANLIPLRMILKAAWRAEELDASPGRREN